MKNANSGVQAAAVRIQRGRGDCPPVLPRGPGGPRQTGRTLRDQKSI